VQGRAVHLAAGPRPARGWHSAWSPKGGTFLAVFQIPSKFFEADGRVNDMGGADWESLWGPLHRSSRQPPG
jgi:hypothetical protein